MASVTRYSLLTTHYSPIATYYLLLATRSSLLATHYSLLTTHYSPLTTHHSLLTTHYSLLTTHYSLDYALALLTIYYSLLTTHYSLLTRCVTRNQLKSIHMTLEAFQQHMVKSFNVTYQAADAYALVIMTRHDIIWRRPITQWRAFNASRFNLLGGCCINTPCCAVCPNSPNTVPLKHAQLMSGLPTPHLHSVSSLPTTCVQDMFHGMPGASFNTFRGVVGKMGCFDGTVWTTGHGCYKAVDERLGPTNFVIPVTDWLPWGGTREPNPIASFVQ